MSVDNFSNDLSMYSTKSAFIVGYTGAFGKVLTQTLAKKKIFGKLILVGRRNVELAKEILDSGANVEQVQVDFDNLDQHKNVFENHSVGFCCLGSTPSQGKEMFQKVDHDYVINVAKLAKEAGCDQFHMVSGQGVKKDSCIFFLKIKGLTEEHVSEMDFHRTSIYHPAWITNTQRDEFKLGDWMGKQLVKPINLINPTLMSVPAETFAKAIVANLFKKTEKHTVEIIKNAELHKLGKEFDRLFK